jgi:tetratricopeptide (TPR) repeat protein
LGSLVVLGCLFGAAIPVWAQNTELARGIEQYQKENYEEAEPLLIDARRQDPQNSTAAFFLGMTYKQMVRYPEAAKNLRDAVSLEPRIKEALVELVDVLYRIGTKESLKEATGWIPVAVAENIYPGKIAFLEGLILQTEGRNRQAIDAFEKAKALDPALSQAADVQIAICHMKAQELEQANEKLKAAILYNPESDLASFARRYLDVVERRMEMERPLRLSVKLLGQYDTNVLVDPVDPTLQSPGKEKEDFNKIAALNVDYVPRLSAPYMFNASYFSSANFLQRNYATHNSWVNSVTAAPGLNFGRWSLALSGRYDNVQLRNPDYQEYLEAFSVGPLLRIVPAQQHLFEFLLDYQENDYWEPITPDEDRDSQVTNAGFNWIWSFKKDSFTFFTYRYADERASGVNWDNHYHRLALTSSIALADRLQLQLGGEVSYRNFKNRNTIFLQERRDDFYQLIAGISYDLFKHTRLIAQYTHIRNNSTIDLYTYDRDLYTGGLEFYF